MSDAAAMVARDRRAVEAMRVRNVLGEDRCDECGALWSDREHAPATRPREGDGRPPGEDVCLVGVAVRALWPA